MKSNLSSLASALIAAMLVATASAADLPQAAPKLGANDHTFLADTMNTNQLAIDVSAYVAKTTQTPKVRQFAQARVDEDKQLAVEFQKANDGVVPTPAPTQQPGINLLGKSGADLDKAYAGMMVAYDDQIMQKFEVAGDGLQHAPAIRDMVKGTLPVIRKHDAAAKALDRSLPDQ
jgi:predicted outer membrane protein